MSKVIKGLCFDKELSQIEDLEFFFISSKDNIVIQFGKDLRCYKRKELLNSVKEISHYGKNFYIIKDDYMDILIDKESYNHLKYRLYSIYKITKTDKIYSKYGILYNIDFYKRMDYFTTNNS
jgi:hypothetical protein